MLELRGNALFQNGVRVCSDNEAVRDLFRRAFEGLSGIGLCTGLGQRVAQCVLAEMGCETVTLEIDPEIIAAYGNDSVIRADAWTWIQDRRFDFAFHDIWSDLKTIPEGDEERLMKRFDIPIQISAPQVYKAGGW